MFKISNVYEKCFYSNNSKKVLDAVANGDIYKKRINFHEIGEVANRVFSPRKAESLVESVRFKNVKPDGSFDAISMWDGQPSRIINKRVHGKVTQVSNWDEFRQDKQGFCGKNILKVDLGGGVYLERVLNKIDTSPEPDVIRDAVKKNGTLALIKNGIRESIVKIKLLENFKNVKPHSKITATKDPDGLIEKFMNAVLKNIEDVKVEAKRARVRKSRRVG